MSNLIRIGAKMHKPVQDSAKRKFEMYDLSQIRDKKKNPALVKFSLKEQEKLRDDLNKPD